MKANKERLYNDVAFLSGLSPARNHKNLKSLNKAADYIRGEFIKAGLECEEQKWIARGNEYRNIIASFKPDKLRRLIVGAHYDAAGEMPGADDNASGVAGLLETARLLTENMPAVDYGIDFVAYSLEEPPYFGTEYMGSFIHAQSLFAKFTPVIGMICYEMIGYFSDKPKSQRFPDKIPKGAYPDTGNFIMVVGIEKQKSFTEKFHRNMKEDSGIDVQVISLPESASYAGLSDQRNYWPFGYKALMINDTSNFRNDNYHEKTDTIDTLDFDRMAEVVNSCCRAIGRMGEG